jgi:hypothetical protein
MHASTLPGSSGPACGGRPEPFTMTYTHSENNAVSFLTRPDHLQSAPTHDAPRGLVGVSRTVYSLVYPETRAAVDALWQERPHALYECPYEGQQDTAHEALLTGWLQWARSVVTVPDASHPHGGFPFAYATAGSTEALRDALVLTAIAGGRLHVFAGEYEGYEAQAAGYGMTVIRHDRADYVATLDAAVAPGDRFFLSQPSATDGNLWRGLPAFLAACESRWPTLRVVLDLTYVGAVAGSYAINAESPAIDQIVWSLSKPFGVYYHRIGGTYARGPLPGLTGNRWFKNLFSLELGTRLLATSTPQMLPDRYAALQRRACESLATTHGIHTIPSDVLLLATADAADARVAGYVRSHTPGARARLCVTPTMDALLST